MVTVVCNDMLLENIWRFSVLGFFNCGKIHIKITVVTVFDCTLEWH